VTDLYREQLKRACADALDALHRTQSMDGLAVIADSLRALEPPYRFHGELMHGALLAPDSCARETREGRGVEVSAPITQRETP
jgi:hypothetical protein